VLLGQDLGGSHERSLRAVARGEKQRERRHHGLAAADIALEQTRHGAAGAQVLGDLAHGALLRRRQRERERIAGDATEILVGRQPDAAPLPETRAFLLDSSGEDEELLVDEPPSRPFRFFPVGGKVHGLERVDELRRARGRADRIGREGVENATNERSPAARRDLPGAMVDRHHASGMEGVALLPLVEELGLRVFDPHLSTWTSDRGSVDRGRPVRLERLRERGVAVVPDDPHRAGAIVGEGLDPQGSPPHAEGTHAAETHEESRRLSPDELRHRSEAAAVLVPERQREEEIGDGRKARFREPSGRRTEARDPGHGVGERERGARRAQASGV
jgi:hypothetical protein